MAIHLRCGTVWAGTSTCPQAHQTVVFDGAHIAYVGPTASAPAASAEDELVDHSGKFVMPGLIDVHTHLAYGNAKSEEDIDLYSSLEFRALRGMFFAQRVLAAGYTSICAPGDAGRVTVAIRDAVEAGLFPGPRITTAGPYITSRQGLTDFYPTWIGVPETAIGRLVRSRDEAIEEIRRQVKDGVDCIKLAMDGVQRTPSGELIAAFNQEETTAMVEECHRMGRKVLAHARGREATLYCARAGVDLIYHAFELDDECLDALLRSKCVIGPTLTLMRNWIDFTRPSDGSYARRKTATRSRLHALVREPVEGSTSRCADGDRDGLGASRSLLMANGTRGRSSSLSAISGSLPTEALLAATSGAAFVLRDGAKLGALAPGNRADLIVLEGNPLHDVSVLQDRTRLKEVYLGGERAALQVPTTIRAR